MLKGKYRVEELIGEGGMGKVYRAKQLTLDKPVVLKVLRQTLLSDERTVARFQREAKAASRLNHPNSISVLDFGELEDAALFIAMEFVSGRDLHQILSKEWPLPEGRVVRIVAQVLSALSDAHGAAVIHRDLKPENIMVEQRRGEPDFVKVLDFGIAKITDASGDDGPALTRAGFVCGTPEYMSPEQARGGSLDPRSDLYAVGVILYQLTSGLLPFESDTAVGFASKHLTEEPVPPSKRRPDARISPALEDLIMRALSKSPHDRPADAETFRAELLAADAERKAGRRGATSGALEPLPRGSGPAEDEGAPPAESPWAPNEKTVRQDPSGIGRPVPLARLGVDATLPSERETGGGMLAFKLVTVALVALSLVLAGVYLYQVTVGGPSIEPYVAPPNAPVRIDRTPTPVPVARAPDGPPYERQVAADQRDPAGAAKLAREGDEAHRRGQTDVAAARYEEAFEKDPTPELSLKLGELCFQRNDGEKAKGWWDRHLRDAADSKARSYIEQALNGR